MTSLQESKGRAPDVHFSPIPPRAWRRPRPWEVAKGRNQASRARRTNRVRPWQLGKPPSRAPGDTGPPWARLPRGKVPGGGRGSRPSSPNRGPWLGSVLGRQGGLIPAPRWVSPLPHLAPPLLCAQTIQCRSNHPGQQTRRCACSCSNPHSRPGSRLTALRTRRATDAACPWSSCGPALGREAARRLPH